MLTVGTYTRRGSEGIYRVAFDDRTGELSLLGLFAPLRNPTFQALHPSGQWLYSVCEEDAAGAVVAVRMADGQIINHQPTIGRGPCHVAMAPTGRSVVSACYGSGAVVAHPVAADGSLLPSSDLKQHAGAGPDTDRQEGPHAHSANFDPSGRFVIAADLGTDRLMVYALDAAVGKLALHQEVVVTPGAGPRHFTFHPNGRWAYLINELDNTVVAYRWEDEQLTPLQTLSTLPADFTGVSYCADIHVHRNGRFLYGTNRGHDSLAIFAVDEATGRLAFRGTVPTGGAHPRNFALSPDCNWLLCANQDSDNIVVFRVADDGARLERVSEFHAIAAPVCLLFMPE